MKKNTGSTDEAVRIGCQAFSLCCLKAESKKPKWNMKKKTYIVQICTSYFGWTLGEKNIGKVNG